MHGDNPQDRHAPTPRGLNPRAAGDDQRRKRDDEQPDADRVLRLVLAHQVRDGHDEDHNYEWVDVREPLRVGPLTQQPEDVLRHAGVQLTLNGPETGHDQNQGHEADVEENLAEAQEDLPGCLGHALCVDISVEKRHDEQCHEGHQGRIVVDVLQPEVLSQRRGCRLAEKRADVDHHVKDGKRPCPVPLVGTFRRRARDHRLDDRPAEHDQRQ